MVDNNIMSKEFDMNAALEAAKAVIVKKQCSSSKFEVKAVLDILKAMGGATPSQVCAAYNAGYGTELKSKAFCDWLWLQAKRGILVKEDGIYKVAEVEAEQLLA
jgi:hypothetical protein